MDTRSLLERLSLMSLTDEACPSPDQLAAYLLGTLDGAEQLSVAAHVRTCPMCQEDVSRARPPEPRPHRVLARLLPSFASGVRGSGATAFVRQYQAADLIVEVTFGPPQGDYWRLTGQVLRNDEGVPDLPVLLRAGRRRPFQTLSDSEGFFTFEDLPAGNYTLSITCEHTLIQVHGLVLSHDH